MARGLLRGRRWLRLVLPLVLVAGLGFRLAVVAEWHVPAGDGHQYYQLSQELVRAHRLAYHAGAPPAFTRLPGYPLFLAFVAVREAPLDLESHLVRATRANAVLDIATALLLFLFLREARAGRVAPWVAVLGGIGCPLLLLLSCYGLSETLATFLGTLEIYLALRVMNGRAPLASAAWCGLAAGLGQLVRADAATVAPAVLWAIAVSPLPWRRRLAALGVCGAVAAALYAPWPIRNLIHFGEPHFEGYQWPAQDGGAPPVGVIHWMRTWSSSAPGESYVPFRMVNKLPVDPQRHLTPAMWDDEAEHRRVAALFEEYNRGGLSPEVDRGFTELGRKRRQRAPWRTWVTLPLRRLGALWTPVPEYELPMRVPWLGLPRHRATLLGVWQALSCALALVGAWALGRNNRRLLVLLVLPLALRSLLHAFAVPHGVTQRYLVEAIPCLIALSAAGVEALLGLTLARRHDESRPAGIA